MLRKNEDYLDKYTSMNNIEVAQYYFDVSNESDFKKIASLFTDSSTYSSQNTGLYLWVDQIIAMQKPFHDSFETLCWEVTSISEEKPGIICAYFDFSWVKKNWETLQFSGIEHIIVYGDKIQHIEIKNV